MVGTCWAAPPPVLAGWIAGLAVFQRLLNPSACYAIADPAALRCLLNAGAPYNRALPCRLLVVGTCWAAPPPVLAGWIASLALLFSAIAGINRLLLRFFGAYHLTRSSRCLPAGLLALLYFGTR